MGKPKTKRQQPSEPPAFRVVGELDRAVFIEAMAQWLAAEVIANRKAQAERKRRS